MIRYDITEVDLLILIDRQKPGWRTRAASATALYRRAGRYGEPDDKYWDIRRYGVPPKPFWGEIKRVYMRLQKNKCAFCERKLTVRPQDHDVEHFRPKRLVMVWPPPGTSPYIFPTGGGLPEGYYLLAYHPLNYATACEHCNRGLKRSYFPIAATRLSGKDDPIHLRPERPLLIYPIGNIDTDPEALLGFKGIAPGPVNADPDSYENHRAQVTIDFFDLQYREELLRERADLVQSLYLALTYENSSRKELQNIARRTIRERTASGWQHANCARCFVALHRRDPAQAKRFVEGATDYLDSLLPVP